MKGDGRLPVEFVPSASAGLLAVQRRAQIEASLMEAKLHLLQSLHAMLHRLPEGDADRAVLAASIRTMEESVLRQQRLRHRREDWPPLVAF